MTKINDFDETLKRRVIRIKLKINKCGGAKFADNAAAANCIKQSS